MFCGLCLESDLVPDSLYSLSQHIHQFVLRHGRVGPLPAAAREGVAEGFLAAEGSKVPGLHVALREKLLGEAEVLVFSPHPLYWRGLAEENC